MYATDSAHGHNRHYQHIHHHHPNHHIANSVRGGTGAAPVSPESAKAAVIFDQFISASTLKTVLSHYRHLCDLLRLKPTNFRHFYPKLKNKIRSWKAQAIWAKFDKRAGHKCYNHGKAASNTKVLIIGCGPCGLRTAIEAQLLGAKVVVVEKRDRFSRNNVLHLWPFVITDLKNLAAKKFYGKFCAGAIDHISIRQLQCILLKVALLLGVEIIEGVSFENAIEPPLDQTEKTGWHAQFTPAEHPVNQYEYDVLVGADGKRNTLSGFRRKEFRGKLAIAITANLINKRTEAEASVEELSGVAFIFNQKFFKDLYAATGIDLENIVYYKDETHYFVMTAKKQSLIEKGVILRDYPDTHMLLSPNNVDRNALLQYAREAADFSTDYRLPHLDFAVNHYGKPDVAMFDFTSMFAAENACRVLEKREHKLLMCLVGDSLLEPFWPTGSGCARGFLSSLDSAWMVRSWASGCMSPLEVLAERESLYRLLAQTTPENLSKDHMSYTLEPSSRYPTVNLHSVLPFQIRQLFNTDEPAHLQEAINSQHAPLPDDMAKKRKRRDSLVHPETLLNWCKKQVALYPDVHVDNMTTSFKDGRALGAIIHRYRPDLLIFEELKAEDVALNNSMAFDLLEREFGVPPVMTGAEMAECNIPDKLSMITYLSRIHDVFRGEIPHYKYPNMDAMEVEEVNYNRRMSRPVNILKNLTNKASVTPLSPDTTPDAANADLSARSYLTNKRDDGRLTCRIVDNDLVTERRAEAMKRVKKRRSERLISPQDKYDRLMRGDKQNSRQGPNQSMPFSDRVKGLEAKFLSSSPHGAEKKPKDMIRAIGRLERSDWNMAAIEKKIDDHLKPDKGDHKEKVPKWNKDAYEDKFHNIERRLRENGEDELTIAKYRDIDASLKRLEKKLREGSTLETGLRGSNKVSNLASQLSSKLENKQPERVTVPAPVASRPVVPMPSTGSESCHFCGTRVYLVERLSTEGKFFHRQCFKCDYCGVILRLGNYIYDREGRYGGKFFCIPHFGLTPRPKNRRKPEDSESIKENIVPDSSKLDTKTTRTPIAPVERETGGVSSALSAAVAHDIIGTPLKKKLSSKTLSTSKDVVTPTSSTVESSGGVDDADNEGARGTTPERVEFENCLIEQSDEEEYLSEDEWTDRNFGASANELDDTDSDDNSDYSDLSDDEVEENELAFIDPGRKLTADETRKLAECWKRRYSTDKHLDEDDDYDNISYESDLESDNFSEEYGAEGDESHTATEGEGGDDDDDEEEGEYVKKAREVRRQELNINVAAPPCVAETSDSGSETEVASDEESEESDTQIDTDSEFGEDQAGNLLKEIPTILINDSQEETRNSPKSPKLSPKLSNEKITHGEKGRWTHRDQKQPEVPNETRSTQKVEDHKSDDDDDWVNEKSASLTNLNEVSKPNPHTEHLKRLLQRTESSEAIAAQRNLQLRRQYLLGNTTNLPRKSVSTADLGNKFKSFMDKISETQKMLNPAPHPSPAMQAFMNSSTINKSLNLSPSAPHVPALSELLPSSTLPIIPVSAENKPVDITKEKVNDTTEKDTSTSPPVVDGGSSENSKSEDLGKLYSFPLPLEFKESMEKTIEVSKSEVNKIKSTTTKSESSSLSEESESDYDNVVPSNPKRSFIHQPLPPNTQTDQLDDINNSVNDILDSNRLLEYNDNQNVKLTSNNIDVTSVQLTNSDNNKLTEVKTLSDLNIINKLHETKNISMSDDNISKNIDEKFNVKKRNHDFGANDSDSKDIKSLKLLESDNKFEEIKTQNELNQINKLLECNKNIKHIEEKFTKKSDNLQPVTDASSQNVHRPTLPIQSDDEYGEINKIDTKEGDIDDGVETINKELVSANSSIDSNLLLNNSSVLENSNFDCIVNSSLKISDVSVDDCDIDEKFEKLVNDAMNNGNESTDELNTFTSNTFQSNITEDKPNVSISEVKNIDTINDCLDSNKEQLKTSLDTNVDSAISLQDKPTLDVQETVASPEFKSGLTEADLSDWTCDNDGIMSADEDFQTSTLSPNKILCSESTKDKSRIIARMASIESLGDTDSAISTGFSKTISATSKPSALADLDSLEFMDTSESASSPEHVALETNYGYSKLEEETPTTPVAPSLPTFGDKSKMKRELFHRNCQDSTGELKTSTETSTETETSNSSSLDMNAESFVDMINIEKRGEKDKIGSNDYNRKSHPDPPLGSTTSSDKLRDCLDDYVPPKRYEGYIPRFKDKSVPIRFARDSIDVHKNSTHKPLFTPSKQDVEERKKNEASLKNFSVYTTKVGVKKSPVSPNTAKKQIEASLKKKDNDKDVVAAMVMSRIARRSPEKVPRRTSRTSASPLSTNNSRSSLFGFNSSQENLLDKTDISISDNSEKSSISDVYNHCNKSPVTTISTNNPINSSRERACSLTNVDSDNVLNSSLSQSNTDNIEDSSSSSLKTDNSSKSDAKDLTLKLVQSRSFTSPIKHDLPATPLTHPEQFENKNNFATNIIKNNKDESYQSQSSTTDSRLNNINKSSDNIMSTPVNKLSANPNIATVDRVKARENARQKARLKTDIDLGLSPPNLAENLRIKLRQSSMSESENDKVESDRGKESLDSSSSFNPVVLRPKSSPSSGINLRPRSQSQIIHRTPSATIVNSESSVKDKDERVRELLAEHRQREIEGRLETKACDKEDIVRERLEEYRQKKGSTTAVSSCDSNPSKTDNSEVKTSRRNLTRRHNHRPSLLELESMQVFSSTTPNQDTTVLPVSNVIKLDNSPRYPTAVVQPLTLTSSVSPVQPISPVSATAPTIPAITPPEKQEKRPNKKGKDRERRRSLIQVFAGMFKSGDDKKKGQNGDGSESCTPDTSLLSSGTDMSTPQQPKSPPHTVRDKFAKLRLSRSKDKQKNEKSRSSSADILDDRGPSTKSRAAFSLPTSPNRQPSLPPYTTDSSSSLPHSVTTDTNISPPYASGTGKSSSSSLSAMHLSTPRIIEEESLSDEDIVSFAETPKNNLQRGSIHNPPGSSGRRQRAAVKAARQAELKRLRMAQEIQRQLEECEVKTRELEERGVSVEKSLRGEPGSICRDEAELMGEWFNLVHEKNALVRWEQELLVRARELELEDRHVRLETDLRHRMSLPEREKSKSDIDREGIILGEMLSILEQKDALVNMLEEDRQRYMEEDKDLESVMARKGLQLSPLRRETGV